MMAQRPSQAVLTLQQPRSHRHTTLDDAEQLRE